MKNLASISAVVVAVTALLMCLVRTRNAFAGRPDANSSYHVLQPITHGNLTIFPVTAAGVHDTADFITLDEGIKSGQVVITEAGRGNTLVRRRQSVPTDRDSAEVNRLVLVNNSDRPLILLAGEIVTGGKQDRVIGKDRFAGGERSRRSRSVLCRAGPLGCTKRQIRPACCPDGCSQRAQPGHGRQRSEPGLGRGSKIQ